MGCYGAAVVAVLVCLQVSSRRPQNATVIPLDHMKAEHIAKIERVLNCELHADYKRLLYDYSPALAKMLSTEWPMNRAIYGDAKTILSVNREKSGPFGHQQEW